MANVDFYILPTAANAERLRFTCKLAEKVYRERQFAYILTESDQQSRQLDDLLWSFRAGSFIPHQVYTGDAPEPDNKILLGMLPAPLPWQTVIINMTAEFSSIPPGTERLIEILDASESLKQAGRIRYKHYQQNQHPIQVHEL